MRTIKAPDGRQASRATILNPSWTDEERAQYSVYPIQRAIVPDGKRVVSKSYVLENGVAVERVELEDVPVAVPRSVPFNKLVVGLVEDGWLTQAEGEAWLDGSLPTPVIGAIEAMSADQQFRARAKAKAMQEAERNDALLFAAAKAKMPKATDEEIHAILDDSFIRWSRIEL